MKNDCANNKTIFCLVVLAIFFSFVFSIDFVNSEAPNDSENLSYFYGSNINEFLKLPLVAQEKVLKSEPDLFVKGYKDSLAKNPENRDKFLDLFIKKDDKGKNLLGDDAKNKLWSSLSKEEQEKSFEIIANKLFDKKYPEGTFKDRSKVGIKKITISDKKEIADKLKWVGNKFGVAGKDGKLQTWIDMENPPRWLKEIEFADNGEINTLLSTGYGNVKVVLGGGTIGDTFGELIGPDGKRIGTRMNEGLKSITYDDKNKQFLVKYDFRDSSGKSVEKTLSLNENDLPKELREKLTGALNNELYGDKLKGILNQFDNIDIGSMGKSNGGLATQKMLSVLYGANEQTTGTIRVSYNEKGDPKVELSEGANLVTIDSNGKVDNAYKQWFSLNGVANEGLDSKEYVQEQNKNNPDAKISDENAVFSFNANGDIVAAKNAKINIDGVRSISLSREEMIGVSVVKNSFLEAIVRGDRAAVIEAVFQKGEGIVGSLLDIESMKKQNPQQIMANLNLEKMSGQLIDILKAELENPDLGVEYKSQIQKALSVVVSNLEKSGQSLADSVLFKKPGELTGDQLRLREESLKIASGEVSRVVETLLNDPESLKKVVLTQDKDAANKFVREYLSGAVSSDAFRAFVDNGLIRDIVDGANTATEAKNRLSGTTDKTIPKFNSEELKAMINSYDFYGKMKERADTAGTGAVDYKENLRTALLSSEWLGKIEGMPEEQRKGIANALVSMVSDVDVRIREEKTKLEENILSDMRNGNILTSEKAERFVAQNGNGIVVDTYLNMVHAYGNKRITFDAQVPLAQFIATSTKSEGSDAGDIIELKNLGQTLITFDGKKTNVLTNPPAGSFVSIGKIVNSQDDNPYAYLRLDSSKFYGYSLYSPESLSTYQYDVTGGFIRANPIVRSYITKPIDADIGANENSKITLFDSTDEITGIFGGRLKKKIIFPKLPMGFPAGPIGEKAGPAVDMAFEWVTQVVGGQEAYNGGIEQTDKLFKTITDAGATPPLILGDLQFVAKHPESMRAMFDFMKQSATQSKNNNLEITPKSITVNGNTATTFTSKGGETLSLAPALRMFMRGYDIVANHPMTPFRHYSPSEAKGAM